MQGKVSGRKGYLSQFFLSKSGREIDIQILCYKVSVDYLNEFLCGNFPSAACVSVCVQVCVYVCLCVYMLLTSMRAHNKGSVTSLRIY